MKFYDTIALPTNSSAPYSFGCLCYTPSIMWLIDRFRRKKQTPRHVARKVVVGLIIGGAIGSIVGKKLLEQHGTDAEEEGKEEEKSE